MITRFIVGEETCEGVEITSLYEALEPIVNGPKGILNLIPYKTKEEDEIE